MTQKDKELLLRDLCTRLPYGVKIYSDIGGDNTLLGIYGDRVFTTCEEPDKHNDYPIECIKPYLRSMSFMTEKEIEIVNNLIYNKENIWTSPIPVWVINESDIEKYIDFCNLHHLDYRGLIEKGLALEAPEDMYKTE